MSNLLKPCKFKFGDIIMCKHNLWSRDYKGIILSVDKCLQNTYSESKIIWIIKTFWLNATDGETKITTDEDGFIDANYKLIREHNISCITETT